MKTYEIRYTEEYVTRIQANSEEEAKAMFQDGDFEQGKYVEGSTEFIDIQ